MAFVGTHKVITIGSWTYKLVGTTCGKGNCSRCPHGPYWYAWIQLRNGKTIKKYIGKEPTEELAAALEKQKLDDQQLQPKGDEA